MITSSFYVENKDLKKPQNAVKSSGCRFVNFKPFTESSRQYVTIEGNSDEINSFNSIFS